MQIRVSSLGWEDPLFLPGNPLNEGVWRATVHGVANSDRTEWLRAALGQGDEGSLLSTLDARGCPHYLHRPPRLPAISLPEAPASPPFSSTQLIRVCFGDWFKRKKKNNTTRGQKGGTACTRPVRMRPVCFCASVDASVEERRVISSAKWATQRSLCNSARVQHEAPSSSLAKPEAGLWSWLLGCWVLHTHVEITGRSCCLPLIFAWVVWLVKVWDNCAGAVR